MRRHDAADRALIFFLTEVQIIDHPPKAGNTLIATYRSITSTRQAIYQSLFHIQAQRLAPGVRRTHRQAPSPGLPEFLLGIHVQRAMDGGDGDGEIEEDMEAEDRRICGAS